ncbi:hypothetical protein HELRODRAFT_167917 [Helobdella robusta]|uniref:THAP-type domain-containing protein n=1 Tax=Helobdella robusta TaxID=6412 RepID=T1EZY5_HELRO|nr:hypothetical protein HELRODRAFT_167917 [Helobdella robusta]ESO10070.1 hypothetical protein HELRODRAFT_167917 [Helobdella robusta]
MAIQFLNRIVKVRFSKHPEKKNKWIASIRIGLNDPNWNPSLDARVCSDHFSDEDFNTIGPNFKRKTLKEIAIPCFIDHKYSTTPALLITKYKKAQVRLMEANMKYKNSVKRELRLSKKYNLLLEKVEELKSLNQELTDKLTRFDNKFLDLFKTERKFNLDQKLFATTLHMYSPKAYDFLRSNGLHLPHSRTLRKFRSSLRMQIDHENNDNNDDDNDGNDDNNDDNNNGNDDSDEMLQEPA